MYTTRDNRSARQTSRAAVLARPVLDAWFLPYLLIAMAVAMFVGYLALTTQAASAGFAIRGVERRIAELEEQRRQLDLRVLTGQSMQAVEGQVSGLGLVPVAEVDFVTEPGGAVAVRY